MVKFGWDKLKRFLAQSNSWTGTQTLANVTVTTNTTLSNLTASRAVLTDANKILASDVAATGTGAPVRETSPTLVTPLLGTPTSGTLTNCTGLPAAGVVGTAAVVANTLKGDGTAGRAIRSTRILIQDAAEAAHIKCTTTSFFNGDANGAQDNIGKDGIDTGVWNLDATGTVLTLLNAGISGDLVSTLSFSVMQNTTGTAVTVIQVAVATGMSFSVLNAATGAAIDLTGAVDLGFFYILVSYVTSA